MMKDEKLDYIISKNLGNIAQFISFNPYKKDIDYFRINGVKVKLEKTELIKKLIQKSKSNSVNIRSYSVEKMKGNKLIFNKKIEDIDEILNIVKNNINDGKYTIINENIDINDGGVSGVIFGEIIEFSPNDTPKCVDKPYVCSMPRTIGLKLLEIVYGFKTDINFDKNYRVEFSIHPQRQGFLHEHTIIWEYEYYENYPKKSNFIWPNRFSEFIGDKTFGLLVAYILGFKVPKTIVLSRNVKPFNFGEETGIYESWIRTCPINKQPGKFYSGDLWVDPFKLMKKEDEEDNIISSILSQSAVEPMYSGACIVKENSSNDIIEGVEGKGDLFMVGREGVSQLPKNVFNLVQRLNNKIRSFYDVLGDVSIEWVYDGKYIWVVQLNLIKISGEDNIIVKGNPEKYIKFNVELGLEKLRMIIEENKNENYGIELIGNIGVTSHFGDLLRLSQTPSILNRDKWLKERK